MGMKVKKGQFADIATRGWTGIFARRRQPSSIDTQVGGVACAVNARGRPASFPPRASTGHS